MEIVTLRLSISNAFLLLGDRPVLVDAGSPKDGAALVAGLREHGVAPSDLALIVLTHGHTDHTGALPAVASGVPVAVGAGDADLVETGANGVLPTTGPVGRLLTPTTRRMTFDGWTPQVLITGPLRLDEYGVGAEVVPVGAHTPGSVAILVDGGDALVGDLVRGGFLAGRVRPGHPLRHFFTEQPDRTRQALTSVLDRGPARLLVGHGGPLQGDDVRRRLRAVSGTRTHPG